MRKALGGLILLALILIAGFLSHGVFSAVQEAAKAELHLSDFQMSLMQGLATSVPLAILSIPLGMAVDTRNRVRILLVMSALWTLGSLFTAYAEGAWTLFAARMFAALGASTAVTIAISLASDLVPIPQRGRAMLVLTLGKWMGTAAAFALGGALLGRFQLHPFAGLTAWRGVHLVVAILSGLATLLLFLLREPARQERVVAAPAPRVVFRELWSRRAFLIPLFAGQVGVTMADVSATIWAAPILSRDYHLAPAQFAGWMGAAIFGAGVIGSILGGLSADFGQRSGKRGSILNAAVWAAALAIPAALFPIMPGVTSFAFAFFMLLLCGTITGLVVATALAVLLPNEVRGLAVGLFIALAGLIGFGLTPSLVTGLSSLMGGETQLAPALAIVSLVVSVAGVVGLHLSRKHAPDNFAHA